VHVIDAARLWPQPSSDGSSGARGDSSSASPRHATGRRSGADLFRDDDYRLYLDLLRKHCTEARVDIRAWVLMPNHVHLILTPRDADSIRRALSKVHRTYAGQIHARLRRTGHFWPIQL
jgi:putative transposase